MKSPDEKPLVTFKDKPLIDYVISNLENSKYIERIYIATSKNSPKVKEHINLMTNKIIPLETPGEGYLEDLSFILSFFEKNNDSDILVFINADLPLVHSDIIDYVISEYLKKDKEALSVYVPLKIYEEHSLNPSMSYNGLVPSGLNILISKNIFQDEEIIIIDDLRLALNINTLEDLKFLNSICEK